MRFILIAAILSYFMAAVIQAQGVLHENGLALAVNELGVPLGVPRNALETFDGPTVHLEGPVVAWNGFSYRPSPSANTLTFVAEGRKRDWAHRTTVTPISSRTTARSSVSVMTAGALRITTKYFFDATNPYLIGSIEVTNTSSATLSDVFVTQEWGDAHSLESWSFPSDWIIDPPVPTGIRRSAWMWIQLESGQTKGTMFTLKRPGIGLALGVDVPLSLWTNSSFPGGLNFGKTNGISFGDFDQDGFIDVFAMKSGNLWRNLDGQDWQLSLNVFSSGIIPNAFNQYYGASFGDYNNDGLPDVATAPRTGKNNLLLNLGAISPFFFDIAGIPALFDLQVENQNLESVVWADADGDGNLDYLLANYPFSFGGNPGNYFYHNRGPIGPGGRYIFEEISVPAGLKNTNSTARSEGAQFLDFDYDGDGDFFCNQTFYQNASTPGVSLFLDVSNNSGMQHRNVLEEGIVFFDMDLDGDYDLFDTFTDSNGVRVFEALGDGSYREMPTSVIDSHTSGLNLGVSAADWDNDGDLDLTTRQVFRRNMFVETGIVKFTVATHNIPSNHITNATPAWGDWDKDGDLDAAIGNWLFSGRFYENTLYDQSTPDVDRRHIRVRVMRDSVTVPAGLETEFGANVEVHIAGEEYTTRRRQFVSSSAGYLNQNEYVLHFAMPPDPAPSNPRVDSVFDLSVQFTGPPELGYFLVDRHVNPVLGGLMLRDLDEREITVFRSGRVRIEGCDFSPVTSPMHFTTTEGLPTPQVTFALPLPMPAPANSFIGIDFDTTTASADLRLTEIILDGSLDSPISCPSGDFNIALWDISNPGFPILVPGGHFNASTFAENSRGHLRCDILLQAGRHYRLVAAVTAERHLPTTPLWSSGGISVLGGLQYQDVNPCDGVAMENATVTASTMPIALRFTEDVNHGIADLGQGLSGTAGIPNLTLSNGLIPGTSATLQLSGALANAPTTLYLNISLNCSPFAGGTLVPGTNGRVVSGLMTDAAGALTLTGNWPRLPDNQLLIFQIAVTDPGAPGGVALSNAVGGKTDA